MGLTLHFLILPLSFVAGKVALSSTRLTSYVKVNDPAVGMTTLGTTWTASSLLNCARACTEREATCHCFTYNETTHLCTPGSYVIPMYFDVPPTEVDMYTSPEGLSCDISSGFEIYSLGDVTVCLWISTSKVNFGTAEQSCKDKGANLVTLQTSEKKDLFLNQVRPRGMDVWIGLDDRARENTFIWHSDVSILTAAQRADLFRPGQPDNSRGREDCIHFTTSRQGLNDIRCTALMFPVCEINIQHYAQSGKRQP